MINNKVVVVTGAGRGIGKIISERLATEGAIVYGIDRDTPDEIVSNFKSYKNCKDLLQADVTNYDSINGAINKIIEAEGRIDVLVNNAGITKDNLLIRMNENEWDAVLNVNLKGTYLAIKSVVKTMMSQKSGRIINIGSIVGSMGNAGQINYSASKAGLIGLSKSLARELASRNILVNVVAPGYVNTEMTEKLTEEQRNYFLTNIPLKRVAETKEIADAVLFFSSDLSSYITGQVLHVNGGLYM